MLIPSRSAVTGVASVERHFTKRTFTERRFNGLTLTLHAILHWAVISLGADLIAADSQCDLHTPRALPHNLVTGILPRAPRPIF